jgi:hypothetical protein
MHEQIANDTFVLHVACSNLRTSAEERDGNGREKNAVEVLYLHVFCDIVTSSAALFYREMGPTGFLTNTE